MSEPIIRVENLGKKYLIKHQETRGGYRALRDVLAQGIRTGFGLFGSNKEQTQEEFWALNDVSFEVQPGEVVGIIGRNGAGKSTLLKILSRITEPTKGRVTLNGRVASLLEVGTGFHPELTGRENIYLNGAILGMSRAEINRKFDEIVAFAEVEKFLDTPVKRYSSGMYVRLAFAVAAHLEPEILIVDEVLAVGDAQFQKKCLGKMGEVAKGGRTVLFVSHNMGTVQSLCKKSLLLSQGRMIKNGTTNDIMTMYLASENNTSSFERKKSSSGLAVEIQRVEIEVNQNSVRSTLSILVCVVANENESISIDLRVSDTMGLPVAFAGIGSFDRNMEIKLSKGINRVNSMIDMSMLAHGSYMLSVDIAKPLIGYIDRLDDAVRFVIQPHTHESEYRGLEQSWGYGSIRLNVLSVGINS